MTRLRESCCGLPAWTLEVLGSPITNEPLRAQEDRLVPVGDDRSSYPVRDKIALLVRDRPDDLAEFGKRFPAYAPDAVEVPRPSQLRFRWHLAKFLNGLPRGAMVVDIASGEVELPAFFRHLHCLFMDRSLPRLERAVALGRTEFAVLADLRMPPLQVGRLAAITSTNTLHHFPYEEIPSLIRNLLRFLRPGAVLACTIPVECLDAVRAGIDGEGRVVRVRGLDGPLGYWWGVRVHSKLVALSARLNGTMLKVARAAIAAAAWWIAWLDTLADVQPVRTCRYLWLVIEHDGSTVRPIGRSEI